LGRTLVAYSTGSAHPATTKTKCKLGKMLLRHGKGPFLRIAY
jgi:hypothetical protein